MKNKESVSDFAKFYAETYMECFPNDDERETFDNFLFYLKQAEKANAYNYHIILAKNDNGDILGGGVFNYFRDVNAGVIEFLAVNQKSQSSGIGTLIYKKITDMLGEDAYNNQQQTLANIFCEIDSPEYSHSSEKKYLYFWNKHQYKHIEFNYIQPALSSDQSSVNGLWLVVSKRKDYNEPLSGEYVLSVLYDYMKYCMKIDDPKQLPEYQAMQKELASISDVTLSDILAH